MIIEHDFIRLFTKFIKATETGRRVKQNGHRVSDGTIKNYHNTLRLLTNFTTSKKFNLKVQEIKGNNKREFNALKKYNLNFYNRFCSYMFDDLKVMNNYVGQNIKTIRSFLNWCMYEQGLNISFFHKKFYALHEEPPIITLSIEQLNFLIFNQDFNEKLSKPLRITKDIFIIGCVTALRISDLRRLKRQHFIVRDGLHYLNISSKKTGYESLIKLPGFAVSILKKYNHCMKQLLPVPILCRFNMRLKQICEQAGWTWPVLKQRKKRNKIIDIKHGNNKPYRFCDLISSHIMRRSCITNMLVAGMPEHVVKKVSGHTSDSKSFFRYVSLAQKIMDTEIDKIHNLLQPAEKIDEKQQ